MITSKDQNSVGLLHRMYCILHIFVYFIVSSFLRWSSCLVHALSQAYHMNHHLSFSPISSDGQIAVSLWDEIYFVLCASFLYMSQCSHICTLRIVCKLCNIWSVMRGGEIKRPGYQITACSPHLSIVEK